MRWNWVWGVVQVVVGSMVVGLWVVSAGSGSDLGGGICFPDSTEDLVIEGAAAVGAVAVKCFSDVA